MSMVFDWHAEPEGWKKHFMISALPQGKEVFEQLSVATDKFKNVEVTMFVNGIPVDAEKFFDSLKMNYDYAVGAKAQQPCQEVANLDDLSDTLDAMQSAIKRHLRKELESAGVEIREDDWRGY